MQLTRALRSLRAFRRDRAGLALTEFALTLPVLLLLGLVGAELTNYITIKMRVSQIALQIADNAARMGTGTPSGPKTISEGEINDVFTGSQLESGGLDLQTNGRVILSDLEPIANPNTKSQYKIVWQRCYGGKTRASAYGNAGDTNLSGIGPTGSMVTAQDYNATMFVEVYYVYSPLFPVFSARFLPTTFFDEIASMAVRDQRKLTGVASSSILPTSGATASSC